VWLFHEHDPKGINYKFLMIITIFRLFFRTFHHISIVFLSMLSCVISYIWFSHLIKTPLPSFLFVWFVNSSKSCQYSFVSLLCTILELAMAIYFNLKVGTIFIEENFFEIGLIVTHCASFLSGLSIFLLKLGLDSSFVIIGCSQIMFLLPSH
jgi:hypothetical protein